jgi:hypothetical protein
MLMDTMPLPPADDPAWALASRGEARFSGGWLPLGDVSERGRGRAQSPVLPVRLRLGGLSAGQMLQVAPLWFADSASLPFADRILLWWTLRVPVYRGEVLNLVLTEPMLLVPRQLRIDIAPVEVFEEIDGD